MERLKKPADRRPAWPSSGRVSLTLCFASCLLLGCFEEPIEERVFLDFKADDSVEIRYQAELHHPEPKRQLEALEERLAVAEVELRNSTDPWAWRFAELRTPQEGGLRWQNRPPTCYRGCWQQRLGVFERWATSPEPEVDLPNFLGDTGVSIDLFRAPDSSELIITSGLADRASRRERRQVLEGLATFAGHAARYLEHVARLWRYLDQHPERARACLSEVFDLDDEVEGERLSVDERLLVDEVDETDDPLLHIFDVSDPDQAFSIQELSRWVFDPFPARLSVHVSGEVLELEGFRPDAEGRLEVPSVTFWDAVLELESQWIRPAPLAAQVRHLMMLSACDCERDFDLEAFLEDELVVVNPYPTRGDVEEALLELLQPQPIYRVVWRSGQDDGHK